MYGITGEPEIDTNEVSAPIKKPIIPDRSDNASGRGFTICQGSTVVA